MGRRGLGESRSLWVKEVRVEFRLWMFWVCVGEVSGKCKREGVIEGVKLKVLGLQTREGVPVVTVCSQTDSSGGVPVADGEALGSLVLSHANQDGGGDKFGWFCSGAGFDIELGVGGGLLRGDFCPASR